MTGEPCCRWRINSCSVTPHRCLRSHQEATNLQSWRAQETAVALTRAFRRADTPSPSAISGDSLFDEPREQRWIELLSIPWWQRRLALRVLEVTSTPLRTRISRHQTAPTPTTQGMAFADDGDVVGAGFEEDLENVEVLPPARGKEPRPGRSDIGGVPEESDQRDVLARATPRNSGVQRSRAYGSR